MSAKLLKEKAIQFLSSRRRAYRETFDGPLAHVVLADIARFCRAHESTAHENERVSAQLDGRREVWLRIQHHLQLTDEQMWELYGRVE